MSAKRSKPQIRSYHVTCICSTIGKGKTVERKKMLHDWDRRQWTQNTVSDAFFKTFFFTLLGINHNNKICTVPFLYLRTFLSTLVLQVVRGPRRYAPSRCLQTRRQGHGVACNVIGIRSTAIFALLAFQQRGDPGNCPSKSERALTIGIPSRRGSKSTKNLPALS